MEVDFKIGDTVKVIKKSEEFTISNNQEEIGIGNKFETSYIRDIFVHTKLLLVEANKQDI